jgi:hypothetical protein
MNAGFKFTMLPQDEARLEYGRLLWRKARNRTRLLRHWSDARHPYAPRFLAKWKPWVEMVLKSRGDDARLDAKLREHGLSLRVVVKEIPPVFGSFY